MDFIDILQAGVASGTVLLDVAQEESMNDSIEAAARDARYRVFASLDADHVVLAHNLDDQAETVLHRLLRGAGLQGLRGIAPRRSLVPGIDVVRPLLAVSRQEIVELLSRHSIPFRTDSTNANVCFTRNQIGRAHV